MIRRLICGAVLLAALGVAPAAQALPLVFKTFMDGPSENPAVPSAGTGTSTVTYDPALHTLRVEIQFTGLTGNTTVAHIHCCVVPPGTVGVAFTPGTLTGFPAGVTSGSYDMTFDMTNAANYTTGFLGMGTAATAEVALVTGMLAGQAYVNVHSSFRTGGEIRGFLQHVPEPGTLLLFGLGALGAAAAARARRG